MAKENRPNIRRPALGTWHKGQTRVMRVLPIRLQGLCFFPPLNRLESSCLAISFASLMDVEIEDPIGPWNLMKSESFSGHFRIDWSCTLIAPMSLSSMSPMHFAFRRLLVRQGNNRSKSHTYEFRYPCSECPSPLRPYSTH